MVADQDEVAYAIIEPHFDAIRDHFLEYETPDGPLVLLAKTRLVVADLERPPDPVKRTPRTFAACRDDGLLIKIDPEAAELPLDVLLAIIAHEMGHALDFLYPARFVAHRGQPATWAPEGGKNASRLRRLWTERSDDQVEWSADSIAEMVTGLPIRYGGPCMLQTFSHGVRPRPRNLR